MKGNVAFTYYLQKSSTIEGEFPYQSLNRNGVIRLHGDHTEGEVIEIVKACLVKNATELFAGLANESDYDDIIVSLNNHCIWGSSSDGKSD